MKWTLLLLLTIFTCSGCDIREREKALEVKEAQLLQREQALELQRTKLELKEQELTKREQQLDSVTLDTALIVDPAIVGSWSVKMTCTETTCPGSAIGDSKSETWDISYQNKNIIVKAKTGEKLERVYTGVYKNNVIQLTENVDVPGTAPATKIVVKLTLLNPTTMEGQREIIREAECKITYALQLSKQ